MLLNVHVKNLALIEETDVYFKNGLNILTGETGAGKSIIIGSINIALGAKVAKDMIRAGAEYALVELLFHIENQDVLDSLKELDVSMEDDQSLLITRKIMNHKSIIKVNGENVTATQLKSITERLIDIHGQHDHQSLLNRAKHLEILDEFARHDIAEVKQRVKTTYQDYCNLKNELKSYQMDEEQRLRECSFCEYEIQDIEQAGLKHGEDIELEADFKKLSNSRKIVESLSHIYNEIGNDNNDSVSNSLSRALREINPVISYDEKIENFYHQLIDLDSLTRDLSREIEDYIDNLSFDEKRTAEVEQRLDMLNSLKAKYGGSIEKVLQYKEEKERKLQDLHHYEESRSTVLSKLELVEKHLKKECEDLTKGRKRAALLLEEQIRHALLDLNFLDVRFSVAFYANSSYSEIGADSVEFMISTNPGEEMKPLAKVASGGELSRIMLALKTILASQDNIGTLIFDEIDVGISGRTAQKVSEKLSYISRNHQVICITHLPQIAAMADHHYLIEKTVKDENTTTNIKLLQEDDSINELARILGGAEITDTVKIHAKEMKDMAKGTKKY